MGNSSSRQIRGGKMKARFPLAAACGTRKRHVSQACCSFGVSGALFYVWKKRVAGHYVISPGLKGARTISPRGSSNCSSEDISRLLVSELRPSTESSWN